MVEQAQPPLDLTNYKGRAKDYSCVDEYNSVNLDQEDTELMLSLVGDFIKAPWSKKVEFKCLHILNTALNALWRGGFHSHLVYVSEITFDEDRTVGLRFARHMPEIWNQVEPPALLN